MTIDGPGAKNVTINGNNTFQDLSVDANVSATVSGLTITGGEGPATYPYEGGGIFNNGTLTVANCVITNNSAVFDGGGIANDGSLTLTSSVVSSNTAASGAGIENDPTASLEISGSTITGNAAGFQGGGLDNAGTATVTGSIVNNNSASAGGGINSDSFAAGEGTLTITNSSVSNNSAADGGGLSVSAGGGLGVPNCIVTIIGSTLANNAIGDSNS